MCVRCVVCVQVCVVCVQVCVVCACVCVYIVECVCVLLPICLKPVSHLFRHHCDRNISDTRNGNEQCIHHKGGNVFRNQLLV